ncbi:MAG TPA: hypothetical protein VGN16_20965 [Acidobacteriaceae bacterium]
MPITFASNKDALVGRAALRKIAKRKDEFLSSSLADDKVTFYFWIEPKEVIQDITAAKKRQAA